MALVTVRVRPRSGVQRVEKVAAGVVVRVKAAPERGRATEEARLVLAHALGVSPADVKLRVGRRARKKVFEIDGLSSAEVERRLDSLL